MVTGSKSNCIYLLFFVLIHVIHSQHETIWYEKMDTLPSLSAWTGTALTLSSGTVCPFTTYCWSLNAAASTTISVSTAVHSSVQLTYSVAAAGIKGSPSNKCSMQYSIDGSSYTEILSIANDITQATNTYAAWGNSVDYQSQLFIRLVYGGSGHMCYFNEFTLEGILTPDPTKSPTTFPSKSPTDDPTLSPSNFPTQSPTAPTVDPTVSPTAVTIPPTTGAPTAAPTDPPFNVGPSGYWTCATNTRCLAANVRPVHEEYADTWVYFTGYGFNQGHINWQATYTIVGAVPCINPKISAIWERIPTYVSVYLDGDYLEGCSDSSSSCGSSYWCFRNEGVSGTYYPGHQFVITVSRNSDTACLKSGTYVNLAVRIQFKCWGRSPAPTAVPTKPSYAPSNAPSSPPTAAPSFAPTMQSIAPTAAPTAAPSLAPTAAPSSPPTAAPSNAPSSVTLDPTLFPTEVPTKTPTQMPSKVPTKTPTNAPSNAPTAAPSFPTATPTKAPTNIPTVTPTRAPTQLPTAPTLSPTQQPTTRWICADCGGCWHLDYWVRYCYDYDIEPVPGALVSQTVAVYTGQGVRARGDYEEFRVSYTVTGSDACMNPTFDFKWEPTQRYYSSGRWIELTYINNGKTWKYYYSTEPCGSWVHSIADYSLGSRLEIGDVIELQIHKTFGFGYAIPCGKMMNTEFTLSCDDRPPTNSPTPEPTAPSVTPSSAPTNMPTTATKVPTAVPTTTPSEVPSNAPTDTTIAPTNIPTSTPTEVPTNVPTVTTDIPTGGPTNAPTTSPTNVPTTAPINAPSNAPTASPTNVPSISPTDEPTNEPTVTTNAPTSPTNEPTNIPTSALCARANEGSFCFTLDVASDSANKSTSYTVDVQNSYGGETEIYDMYFTARDGPCYDPYININYTAMSASYGLSVLDDNNQLIAQCRENTQCGSYSECIVDYNLGIGVLSRSKTYLLTIFGRYLKNECNGTNTFDAVIEFVCAAIAPPSVAPTGNPIAPTVSTATTEPTTIIEWRWSTTAYILEGDGKGSGAGDAFTKGNLIVIGIGAGAVVIILCVVLFLCKRKKKGHVKFDGVESPNDVTSGDEPEDAVLPVQSGLELGTMDGADTRQLTDTVTKGGIISVDKDDDSD